MRRAALLALLLATAGWSSSTPRVATGASPRLARVVERADAPAGWRAIRDRDTGALAAVWGGSILVRGAIADAAIAERAARDFTRTLIPADLAVIANRVERGRRSVVFEQTLGGLRVVGAHVVVVFAHDRLFAVTSTAVPVATKLAPAAGRATTAKAAAWLRADGIAADVHATGERVVLPLIYGPSAAAGDGTGAVAVGGVTPASGAIAMQIVDVLDARAGVERWTVYASSDGTPVLRESRVAHGSGRVRLDVPVRHPLGPRVKLPAAHAQILTDGLPVIASDVGLVTWSGTAAATIVPSTNGPLVRVIDDANAPVTGSFALANNGVFDWNLATDGNGDAQLTAFAYVTVAKARARAMHPSLAWLDQQIAVHVNAAGSCNALSTGDDLVFFGAGACENAARITDIVLHEFAHSFHTQSFLGGGAPDLSLGEGLADFFAANITGDSAIGRGLHFDDNPVRDLDPAGVELRFPDDLVGDTHVNGLIIGGALWDLRDTFIAQFGNGPDPTVEQIYLGVVEFASDLSTAYLGALIGDDDDGDLGNGTPHECMIEKAFAAHGLVPDFATTEVSPPNVDGRELVVDVTVPQGRRCPPPLVTNIDIVLEVDGATETIAMTASGDRYTATLPAASTPKVIRYQVIAHLDDDSERVFPDNPADPMYQLFVGVATPIWCDRLDTAPRWTPTGVASWEWSRPFGHAGDPPATFTGEAILGTNISGTGRYPTETTRLTTPPIDASGFEDVHLQFRRWLTVEAHEFDRAAIEIDGAPLWENAGDGFDHVDREWRFVDLPLPSRELALTFLIDPDGRTELGGWNLDDVCVVTFDADACPDCFDPPDDGGCCSSSDHAPGSLLLGGVLWLVLRRRRTNG